MTALMILIVSSTVAWRGTTMDPAAAVGLTTAQIPFATLAACNAAKPRIILDAQAHQWTASAVCVESGGK